MTAKSKSQEPLSRKPSSSNDITARIRQRAYQLYEQRGKVDGFCPRVPADGEPHSGRDRQTLKSARLTCRRTSAAPLHSSTGGADHKELVGCAGVGLNI